jgi:hypothetical protein
LAESNAVHQLRLGDGVGVGHAALPGLRSAFALALIVDKKEALSLTMGLPSDPPNWLLGVDS